MSVLKVELQAAERAVQRAQRVLWQSQRSDGSWDSACEVGPWVTAQAVVALRWLGVLDEADTAGAVRWLAGQQRHDGSFAIHPLAPHGDLAATASAWAALHSCGDAQAAARARAWVNSNGGVNAVIERLATGDLAAVFLSLAGVLDPRRLPLTSTTFLLAPPVLHFLQTRFHSGVFMAAFQLELIIRRLRGHFGQDGTSMRLLDRVKSRKCIELLARFQNTDGSWNDSSVLSVLALPALVAAGLKISDPMLARPLQWLEAQKIRDKDGLHFAGFGTEVWSTGFDVRALLGSGAAPSDPRVRHALQWLTRAQLQTPMPAVDNRQKGAPLTGAWAFQATNHTMPDADDTGVVLSALGAALKWRGTGELDSDLQQRLRACADQGRAWLRGMQNPDGGWSAYVWGLPGKKPGPAMSSATRVDPHDLVSLASLILHPPASLSDPSTEDLTARVLHGLGQLGHTVHEPDIARAIRFLQQQQCDSGAWWGRWVVNYLSSTAFVLMALRSVRADLHAPWVQKAIAWVLSKQNADGGWGEGPESYRNPALAGLGPSMPPLTGLVVQGLLDTDQGESESVERAIGYLLTQQRSDGTWPNGEYLHANIPPETFFVYPEAARFYPTEALGKYLAFRRQRPGPPGLPRWNGPLLDAMRDTGDPLADAVIENVFATGAGPAVRELMGNIFRTDEPMPLGLPENVVEYFSATAPLPAWADPTKIALAQQLFSRAGWQAAIGLFCSALPQSYAAAKGAHVIVQTQALTRHVHQRIFETAQFLFDVLDDQALFPGGRGIRAIQKVRLMHAGVRHLLLTRTSAPWDSARLGHPINQEDLAGTLMGFSVVTLDALDRLGSPASPGEAAAWIHTWKVIGHLLGVREDLLPADHHDSALLMDAIRDRQWAACADGQGLIKPLIALMESFWPGHGLDGLPVALVRHLAGDHCADLLGLPRADWTQVLIRAGSTLDALLGRATPQLAGPLIAHVTQLMMKAIVAVNREGKQARFRLPTSLLRTVVPDGNR